MELVLLRHGEAERVAGRDELRCLTARGQEEVRASGAVLAALSLKVPVVVSSPYRRARQTADLVAEALAAGTVREMAGITPDDDVRRAALRVAEHCVPGTTLVVVTHMPLIGGLLSLLIDDDPGHPRGVRTAGGAVLRGEFVAPGQMRIGHLLG